MAMTAGNVGSGAACGNRSAFHSEEGGSRIPAVNGGVS